MDNFTNYIISITHDSKGVIEFERSTAKVNQVASLLGKSLGGVSTVIKDQAKAFQTSKGSFEKHTITFKDLAGNLKIASGVFKDVNGQWVLMSQGASLTEASVGKLSGTTVSLVENLKRLAYRAMLTIPLWLVLRGAVMGVMNAVKGLINDYKELEAGMQKVMAVAQYTSTTQSKVYAELEQKARQYFATSTAGFKDITEAMYELGSAGRSNEEMAASLKPIMDLALGSYTNVKNVARAVAGILNVFGDQFTEVGNKEQQLTYISNLLADSWRKHQVEINEITEAYKYLGAVGGVTGVKFTEFLSAVGAMGDEMNRSSRAGRNLSTALVQLSVSGDKAREILGLKFDERQALNFLDIMRQLKEEYDRLGRSPETTSKFKEVFGEEGARAIMTILVGWDKFLADIERTPESVAKTSEQLKKLQENTWGGLFTKTWRMFTTSPNIGTGKSPIKDWWGNVLSNWEKDREAGVKLVETFVKFGDTIKLTKEEASALSDELRRMGQTSTANKILQDYGLLGSITEGDYFGSRKSLASARSKLENVGKEKAKVETEAKIKETIRIEEQKLKEQQTSPLSETDKRELTRIQRITQAQEMRLRGYTEESIVLQDIKDWMNEQNELVDTRVNKQINLNDLMNQDLESLRKSGLSMSVLFEGMKKVEEYQRKILEDSQKYADILENNINSSIKEILGGTKGIGDLFNSFNNAAIESYKESIAQSFTNVFMGTGIGEVFGRTFGGLRNKIETAFDSGGKKTYDWIMRGFEDATGGRGRATTARWSGGAGGIVGAVTDLGQLTLTRPANQGFSGFTTPFFGYGSYIDESGTRRTTKGGQSLLKPTAGQKFMGQYGGAVSQGALTGYSATQSARAGGIPLGQSIGAGILSGVGGTLLAVAALNAWNPVGWAIAGGVMLAGILTGSLGSKASRQTSVETKTAENRISSRIDVTNKQLEIVNRNLIALRSDIQTYILPATAYFSEKRGIEDEFSLYARRGLN